MSAMNDKDWWDWRRDAVEAITGIVGYTTSWKHLSSKALLDVCSMIHDAVEMNEWQLKRWEKICENLSYCIGWEEEQGDPRKRNYDYARLPSWYFEQ